MEKDDILQTVFWSTLNTDLDVSGLGGTVYGLLSPQFPSLISISTQSLSFFFPWLPLLLPRDRNAIWALRRYCGYRTLEPLLVWMSHYSFYPQRIKVSGGLGTFCSMTLYGIALHDSLNDSSPLKFLPWVFPNSPKPQKRFWFVMLSNHVCLIPKIIEKWVLYVIQQCMKIEDYRLFQ